MNKNKHFIKVSTGERIFYICNYIFMTLFCISIILPFLNIIAISLNDGKDTAMGGITIYPRIFTFDNYTEVLKNGDIANAYFITISRTVIGVILSVFLTAAAAFALKSKTLPGRSLIIFGIFFTTLFGGGLIPYFILLRNIGLYNTFWVYIIPGLYSFWNMIIMRTFFEGIGISLEESAKLDGAGDFRIFMSIIIPLSKAVLAVIALFNGVGHWNDWFAGVYYVSEVKLQPMQTLLWKMISTQELLRKYVSRGGTGFEALREQTMVTAESLKAATVLIAAGPIILMYPFCQKYFVKGVMIGAIKG